jgi:predicted DNA-binding ribbon-helix-helix protein
MSDDGEDIALEEVIEGDADVEAYNEQVEQRFDERLAELAEQEQEAVSALLDEAEESADTETVEFPSGLELEVKTRIPVDVEQRLERIEQLGEREARDEMAVESAHVAAAICETEGYDDPDTWLTAWEKKGTHWLSEMLAEILDPAVEEIGAMGNRLRR